MGKNLKYSTPSRKANEFEFQHLVSVRWCHIKKNSLYVYVRQCAFLETTHSLKLALLGRPASNILGSLDIVFIPPPSVGFFFFFKFGNLMHEFSG